MQTISERASFYLKIPLWKIGVLVKTTHENTKRVEITLLMAL